MKKRIDILLVEKGLVSSRTKAQDLIVAGKVFVIIKDQKSQIKNASEKLDKVTAQLVIEDSDLEIYVSRAGLKLEGALKYLKLSINDYRILDVGQSTGGFTDCCLQNGAKEVVGIEVGRDQLVEKIRSNPKVKVHEGVNARNIPPELHLGQFDMAVMDLSFISLTLVLPEISKFTDRILALVKPQFEVGPKGLAKGGVVKDHSQFINVENKIKDCISQLGWTMHSYFPSSIEGKDGNLEFFVYLQK